MALYVRRNFLSSCLENGVHYTPPLYLVNAWAVKNGVSFGQIKVNDKSNEITAIPKILDLIDIKGATITIDAIGAQKEITKKITEKKADFAIGLKGNQPTLHAEAVALFESKKLVLTGNEQFHVENIDSGQGRVETGNCYHIPIDFDWMPSAAGWSGLVSLIVVESERYLKREKTTSKETRLYISSLAPNPTRAQATIRAHWSVENNLQYALDVTFDDDRSRIRKDRAPQNYAIVKKWVLGLLKRANSKKESLKTRRARAAMDTNYLELLWSQVDLDA